MRNTIIISAIITLLAAGDMQARAEHPHHEPDVYVVGYELSAQNVLSPVLWKNGVSQYLSKGVEVSYEGGFPVSVAGRSVYVAGDDVYVSGYKNGRNEGVPEFWKNGVAQILPDDSRWGMANSVFVSGDDVYVVGSKTWKNGDVFYEHGGNSVFISDSDVYVAGWDDHDAILWKNGMAETLPGREGGDDAMANSVYVSGSDVYVAGWKGFFHDDGTEYLIAVLWKNGVEIPLTDGNYEAEANSVFVSGNDVYVAGRENDDAVLWKNGVAQKLNDDSGPAIANSVFLFGSDVYVAGAVNGTAKVWRNGIEQILTANGSKSSAAYGLFVK